jgi:DNA polymerase-1
MRNKDVIRHIKGKYEPKAEWATSKAGVYSSAETVLEELGTPFTLKLLEYRKVQKEYSTYAEKLPSLIWPDGKVHPKLHQTSTNTGRLSCASPNMQNWPSDSEVKAIFVSRFKGGKIVAFDFKQMEVIALAYLSQDAQLLEDVLNGRDIHEETGKVVFGGRKMTKEERRIVKTVNFGLAYGGGAKVLALQAKIPEEQAKQIIDAFYHRYPDVYGWQQENIHMVNEGAAYMGHYLKGNGVMSSILPSVTGRRYLFTETFAPQWMDRPFSFSPTEIKNYPVQGLATADIVPMMMGKLLRELKKNRFEAKLVNQVHDSILLDVPEKELDKVVECGRMVLESNYFEEVFGVPFLPLKVSIGIGDNWLEADKE